MSDLEAVPNPVIHSCQILDPGRDVRRIEIVSEGLKRGRQMGYSRAKIVDADQPEPGAGTDPGPGHQHRHPTRGPRADGGQSARGGRLPRPAPAVAGVRRSPPRRRPLGAAGTRGRGRLARRRAAHRAAVRHPRDRGRRRGGRTRRHRPRPGRVVARDVRWPAARSARSASKPNRCSAPTAWSPSAPSCTTKASTTASPRWGRTCSVRPNETLWACLSQSPVPSWKATSPSVTTARSGSPSSAIRRAAPCSGCTALRAPVRQIPMEARVYAEQRQIRLIGIDRPGIGSSTPYQYDTRVRVRRRPAHHRRHPRDRQDGGHRPLGWWPLHAGLCGRDARPGGGRRRHRRCRPDDGRRRALPEV